MTKKKIRKTRIKKELKNEIFLNVPNIITLARLILVFVFMYLLFNDYSKIYLITVFSVAALSDWFDGFFARKLKQTTQTGARMDQVIDRVFTTIIFVSLLFYFMNNPDNNHSILLLFLSVSREIIGTPGFLIALIRGKDSYKVRFIGKVMTLIQGFALGAIILGVSWAIFIVVPTCIIGILAGIDYLRYSIS
jgi:CDP-diacylglycerol--glycerol-3-phosphate 3-phosphatidyltransferase